MTEVKICGLTRKEDIQFVNSVRPEYVGFVFAKSKRQVNRENCKRLIGLLHKDIKTVGVFVNRSILEVNNIAQYCNLDIVQLHGDETPEECQSVARKVWKAFRVKDQSSFSKVEEYQVDGYLFDAYHEHQFGGTGNAFEWNLLMTKKLNKSMILAGGITPENVQDAIKQSNAQIIDVSSGVETNGLKDFDKIKTLLERVNELG